MSFTSRRPPENRRVVSDLVELRALAHPLRLALLDQLMSLGDSTAARCAAAVGSTASNCSYHLRALARAGFVERVDGAADGRERLWRATASGIGYGSQDPASSPAAAEAARAVQELAAEREEELTRLARRRHADQVEPWRSAEAFHAYALCLTTEELARLTSEIDLLLRPYIAMTRADAPSSAAPARVQLQAFRDPRTP